MRRAALTFVPFFLAVACGGPATDTNTPVASVTATATAAVPTATGPDMSPVTRPASVLVVGRLNNFAGSIDAVDQLLKLPESVKSLIDKKASADGVDFIEPHASFDAALALDSASRDDKPRFLWVFSIPLKSIDAALAHAQKKGDEVHPTTPGAYRVKHEKMTCDLAPSLGDAPARAICTEREESLAELTPWMTRGLAADPKKSSDLWVRAELGPLRERYAAVLKLGADKLVSEAKTGMSRALNLTDPDLLDAPSALERELFAIADDADAVELSIALDAKKPELRVSGNVQFKGKTSWFAQVLASALDRPEGPPDLFFRLPKDSTSGSWGRAADPALFTGIRRIVHKAVAAALAQPDVGKVISDADKQALIGWFDAIPTMSGVWVGGSGMLPSKGASAKPETAQQVVDAAKALANRFVPWSIAGGDGDPAQFIAWMKSTDDVMTRAVADVKKAAGKNAKDLDWLPAVKFTPNAAGLPKGSATLDVTVAFTAKEAAEILHDQLGATQPKGDARGSVTLRIAVVPDDTGHFWWGYSTDPEALRSHLAAVAKGGASSGTLAGRTDLDPLKSMKGFGGFLSYGSLVETIRNSSDMSASDRKMMDDVVSKLPHKAQGDIFVSGGGTSPLPSFSFDFIAGKDAVEDLASAVNIGVEMARSEGKHESSPPPAQVAPTQPKR